MNCFPFEDPCVVVRLPGHAILSALENGVSTYPALEGRFPQVSGIRFSFDPSLPPGSRCSDVHIAGSPLENEREYTLCTREYMVRGKDGFDSLLLEEYGGIAKSIVDEENGLLISIILRQYFLSLKVLGKWRNWSESLGRHWGGVQRELHGVHPVKEPPVEAGALKGVSRLGGEEYVSSSSSSTNLDVNPKRRSNALTAKAQDPAVPANDKDPIALPSDSSDSEDDDPPRSKPTQPKSQPKTSETQEQKLILARKVIRKWWRLAGLKGHPACCEDATGQTGDGEFDAGAVLWTRGIAPRVEGRITILGVDDDGP